MNDQARRFYIFQIQDGEVRAIRLADVHAADMKRLREIVEALDAEPRQGRDGGCVRRGLNVSRVDDGNPDNLPTICAKDFGGMETSKC